MSPRKIDSIFYELEMHTQALGQGRARAERDFDRLAKFFVLHPQKAITGGAAAIGAALIGIGVQAAKMAAEVDKQMRKVQTTTLGSASQFKELRKEIEAISRVSPRSQAELSAGAAQISASGAKDPGDIAQRLRAAVDIADASTTDLSRVIEMLDLVTDGFSRTTRQATNDITQMFAIAKGKVNLEELFGVMEKGASTMGTLNIGAVDFAKSLTAIVDAGETPRKAGTVLTSVLEQVASAREKVAEATGSEKAALQSLINTLGPGNIATKGLTGALRELGQSAKEDAGALQRMGFSLGEANAIIRVSKAEMKAARSESDELAAAQKTLAEAARINRGDMESLNQIIKNGLNAELIRLGNETLPPVLRGMQMLADVISPATREARLLEGTLQRLSDPDMRARFTALAGARLPRDFDPMNKAQASLAGTRPGDYQASVDIGRLLKEFAEFGKDLFKTLSPEQLEVIRDNLKAAMPGSKDAQEIREVILEMDRVRVAKINEIMLDEQAAELAAQRARNDEEAARKQRERDAAKKIADAEAAEAAKTAAAEMTKGINEDWEEFGKRVRQAIADQEELRKARLAADDAAHEAFATTIRSLDEETRQIEEQQSLIGLTGKAYDLQALKLERVRRQRDLLARPENASIYRQEQIIAALDRWEAKQQNIISQAHQVKQTFLGILGIVEEFASSLGSAGEELTHFVREGQKLATAVAAIRAKDAGGAVQSAIGGLGVQRTKFLEGHAEIERRAQEWERMMSDAQELAQRSADAALAAINATIEAEKRKAEEELQRVKEAARAQAELDIGVLSARGQEMEALVARQALELSEALEKNRDELFRRTLAEKHHIEVTKLATQILEQKAEAERRAVEEGKRRMEAMRRDAFSDLDGDFAILNTDLKSQTNQFLAALFEFVPGLRDAMGDIATDSAEAREAARETFRAFWRSLGEESSYGGLERNELQRFITDLFRMFDQLDEAAAEATGEALPDPVEIQRTADALRRLQDRFELLNINNPIEQWAAKVEEAAKVSPVLANSMRDIDLSSTSDIEKARAAIAIMFKNIEAGVTYWSDDSSKDEFLEWLKEFDSAVDTAAETLADAAASMNRAVAELERRWDIEGLQDPVTQIGQLIETISAFAPSLSGPLAGFDLKSESGRSTALQQIRELYNSALASLGMDGTDKNATEEQIELLRRLANMIRGIPVEIAEEIVSGTTKEQETDFVQSARGLTEYTGMRMADYLHTIAIGMRHVDENTKTLADMFSQYRTPPGIAPPPMPFLGAQSISQNSSAVHIQIRFGNVTVNVGSGFAGDGVELGRQIGTGLSRAMRDEIDAALGAKRIAFKRRKGDTEIRIE